MNSGKTDLSGMPAYDVKQDIDLSGMPTYDEKQDVKKNGKPVGLPTESGISDLGIGVSVRPKEPPIEEFDPSNPAFARLASGFSTEIQTAAEVAQKLSFAKKTDPYDEYLKQLDIIKFNKQKESKELKEYLAKTPSPQELTFMDRVKEIGDDPTQLLPFFSGAKETAELMKLMESANRLDQDIATDKDLLLLKQFVDKAGKETTFWYDVMDVMAELPSFAGELFTTGGIYTAAKKATVKGSTTLLKKMLTEGGRELLEKKLPQIAVKAVGGVAGAVAQTIPAGITRITAGTVRNMMPEISLSEDEEKQIIGSITKEGDEVLSAATKALGSQWIETLSERSGGLFNSVGKVGKEVMIRHGLLKSFLKANPKANVSDFMQNVKRAGYDGIVSEILEERAGEIGRAAIGLEDYKLPTPRQLLTELVSFSIPGLTIAGINKATQKAQTKEGLKKVEEEIEKVMPLTEAEKEEKKAVDELKPTEKLPEKPEDLTEQRKKEWLELVEKDDIEGINKLREQIQQDVREGKTISDEFLKTMEVPTKEEILEKPPPEAKEQPITKTTYDFETARPEMTEKFEYFTKEVEGKTEYFKKEKLVSKKTIPLQREIKRLSPTEEQGRIEGGETNVQATIITQAVHRASAESEGFGKKLSSGEIKTEEESALEQYARGNGIWIEDPQKTFGEPQTKGTEQNVYLNKDGITVTKINPADFHESWLDFLDRISIHNALFPETKYQLKGFTKLDKKFSAIIEQPLIKAERGATKAEIVTDLKNRGFEGIPDAEGGMGNDYRNKEHGVLLNDLHGENVLIDKKGNLFYIDPIIFADTPEQGYGGTRKIELSKKPPKAEPIVEKPPEPPIKEVIPEREPGKLRIKWATDNKEKLEELIDKARTEEELDNLIDTEIQKGVVAEPTAKYEKPKGTIIPIRNKIVIEGVERKLPDKPAEKYQVTYTFDGDKVSVYQTLKKGDWKDDGKIIEIEVFDNPKEARQYIDEIRQRLNAENLFTFQSEKLKPSKYGLKTAIPKFRKTPTEAEVIPSSERAGITTEGRTPSTVLEDITKYETAYERAKRKVREKTVEEKAPPEFTASTFPEYTTKDNKYTVSRGAKSYVTGKGKREKLMFLEVLNNKTGKIVAPTSEGGKRAIEEYKERVLPILQRGKETELTEGMGEEQARSKIAETSENPAEVAREWLSEAETREVESIEDAIYTFLPKITAETFARYGDPNFITGAIRLNYFATKEKGGTGLDKAAEQVRQGRGEAETMEESTLINKIIDFITEHPGGKETFDPRSQMEKDLAERFVKLTGFEIDKAYAEKILKYKPEGEPTEAREDVPEEALLKYEKELREVEAKRAEQIDNLMEALGVKAGIIGERRPDVIKALQGIAETYAQELGLRGKELIRKVIEHIKEKIKDFDIRFIEDNEKEILGKFAEPLTEKERKAQEKKRGFAEKIEASKLEFKKKIPEESKFYTVKSNTVTEEQAQFFLDKNGYNKSLNLVTDEKTPFNSGVRTALGIKLIDESNRLGKEAKEKDNKEDMEFFYDNASKVAEFLMKRGTELGQEVQAYYMWTKVSPEAHVHRVKKELKKAGVEPTPEQEKKIKELAKKIQTAPEGKQKSEAAQDLMNYQLKIQPTNWGDVGMSIWYAHILSGYTTQQLNIGANMLNTAGEIGVSMTLNPKSTPYLLKGLYEGYGRGLLEAWRTLKTGYKPLNQLKYELEGKGQANLLESKKFWGGKWNPFNYHKYVSRFMMATDAFNFYGVKHMRAYELALREARMQKKQSPDLNIWKYVNQKLYNTDEQLTLARQKATKEGLKGHERRLRVREIMEQNSPHEIMDDAGSLAAHSTFNYKYEGHIGLAAAKAAEFANSWSLLGFKPFKFVVPFTRITSNVISEYLDWTLWGFARAARSERGIYMEEDSKFNRKLTPEERKRTLTKAILGSTAMALAYALTDGDDPVFEITANGTGDYRKNYELRERPEGWNKYSIRIGKKWYSYQNTPLSIPFSIIGHLRDFERYRDKTLDDDEMATKLSIVIANSVTSITDFTFLMGLSEFMASFSKDNPEQAASTIERFGKRIVQGFVVPNLVTQTSRAIQETFDMPMKDAKTLYEQIIRDIPVARNGLNDLVNSLGEPVIPKTSRWVIDPEAYDPVWDLINKKKAWIGKVNKGTVQVWDIEKNQYRPVTEEEYYNFAKLRGQKIRTKIEKNLNKLKEMLAEEVRQEIENYKREATKEAKKELKLSKIKSNNISIGTINFY